LGVEVLTSRTVKKAEPDARSNKWNVVLEGGETLTADLYISTTGVIPNNDFIPANFLSSDGWVTVDSQLRVQSSESKGKGSIYAIGDITNLPMRLLSRVPDQVSVLVANLKADIAGQGKHPEYSSNKMMMMVVPVGKAAGTGQLGSWVPWSFVATMIKSKNFFIPMAPSFFSGKRV
jgi:pyruvate/2-oxoglutarate dehydrogenase complex dihydrolipoamide dehydrogenase (E3) component